MATLVLTVAGTILGGPIGGAIGALAGQVIDREILFAPPGRQGPRLNDLRVQTSTYGTFVPRLYGAMRVAGTVIWASDLVERTSKSGGGKGQPSVTTYHYSASFAVALSSRPVARIGRIWADGNLLRGAAGDFKSGLGAFRFHIGTWGQAVDPLIGAAVGTARAPAHRDMAYAVFEDLDLADFGNRIPSLTFEVFGDEGAVELSTLAADLTDGMLDAQAGLQVAGYAASGESVRAALGPLVTGFGLMVQAHDGGLRLSDGAQGGGDDAVIARADIVARADERTFDPPRRIHDPLDGVPVRLTLRHYEPERDYQTGVQTATRPGTGVAEDTLDLPATLSAQAARALASRALDARMTGRARLVLDGGWPLLALAPGQGVRVDGYSGRYVIEEHNWDAMRVEVTARRVRSGASAHAVPAASAGQGVQQDDVRHGPTRLVVAELPALTDEPAAAPVVAMIAAGAERGWRRAALFVRDDDASLIPVGSTAAPAVMGTVMTPPLPAGPYMFDMGSAMEVELDHDAMTVSGVTDLRLSHGGNLALVGDELLQFGNVTPLGGRRYRLGRLLRGRRGTQDAARAPAVAGARFVLLEIDRLALAAREQGGDLHIDWVRCSRTGWRWIDGSDAPLGEESEAYRLVWSDATGPFRTVQLGVPNYIYDAAARAVDRAAGHVGPVSCDVAQVGTHGVGPAARIHIIP